MAAKQLPPFCGQGLNKPLLYNPYQVGLLDKRRLRICPKCRLIAPVDGDQIFRCPSCRTVEPSQLIAVKAFRRLGAVGGRRSGKTTVGAHAAREECTASNGLGWVCGPTFPILRDSTMPTFFKIIPPHWVKHWDAQYLNLTLVNNHVIQFRSLDDPNRAIGMGPWWTWLDECQKIKERAWDVLRPSLTDQRGNTIFTWTPNGFDWTWRRLWRAAHGPFKVGEVQQPGFWMAKWKTTENPYIQRYAMDEVEEARSTMPPEMFRQEYEADFVSFAGNIYDWDAIEPQILRGIDAVRAFIPEWPHISPERLSIVGLGGGVTHPFAGVLVATTDQGLVVLDNYKREHRAVAFHHDELLKQFNRHALPEAGPLHMQLALSEDVKKDYIAREFNERGTGVARTEDFLMAGVQRTQSWLYAKQLWFADTAEHTLDQLRGYRWNDIEPGEERIDEEGARDLRKDNELPTALHAAVLSWPEIPKATGQATSKRWESLTDKQRADIDRMRRHTEGVDDDVDEDNPFDIKEEPRWPMVGFGLDFGDS